MEPQSQNPMSPAPQMPTDKSVGPAIGIIIIIIIIVLGGLYFWGQRVNNQPALQSQNENVTPGADINELQNQSSSDDVSSIEADLKATNFDSLGTEVNSIDAETQAQ